MDVNRQKHLDSNIVLQELIEEEMIEKLEMEKEIDK